MVKKPSKGGELRSTMSDKRSNDLSANDRADINDELKELISSTLSKLDIDNNTKISEAKLNVKNKLVLITKLNLDDGDEEMKAAKELRKAIDQHFNRDQLSCLTNDNLPVSRTRAKAKKK